MLPVSTAAASICLAVIVAAWIAGGRYPHKLRRCVDHPIRLAALVLFAWLAVSLAWSETLGPDQAKYLRKYADLPLIAVFSWFLVGRSTRERALLAFACAMLLTLALSFSAAAGVLPSFDWLQAEPGNAVVFKRHITHGLLMSFAALLFALYAIEARRTLVRVAWATASALASINVVFMVQGRTGYVVFAVFILLVFATRYGWRGLSVAGVLVLAGAVSVHQLSPKMRQRVDLAVSEYRGWDRTKATADSNSIGRRLEFFAGSTALVAQRPLLGYGLGGFPAAYAKSVEGSARVATVNPHNEYLLLAVQGGLPAVALFLWLLARISIYARALASVRERLLARALALWMAVGCLVNALLIDHTESLMFGLFAGLLFAGFPKRLAPAIGADETRSQVASALVADAEPCAPKLARLSVVIIARDEAARIGRCLDSVRWANEVVVLDGGSTDATVALARERRARVEIATDWPGFGMQKNRALALASGEWILSLDADEWVEEPLAVAIRRVIAEPAGPSVWRMPRRSRYCGQVMRHSGWSPDYVTRLWRRGAARFSDDLVHERVLIDSERVTGSHAPATLRTPLDHETVTRFEQVIDKMNRYSTDGAQMMHARGVRGSVAKALGHGLWTFVRTYVLRLGFLDGRFGLLLAISNAEGSYYRYLKLMLRGSTTR
ncbi:MAG: O-antigen ligase family protein [Proteobacteria bacterium]|nr:O-antigen ligase family protein [Burkholderiales bacterium]